MIVILEKNTSIIRIVLVPMVNVLLLSSGCIYDER